MVENQKQMKILGKVREVQLPKSEKHPWVVVLTVEDKKLGYKTFYLKTWQEPIVKKIVVNDPGVFSISVKQNGKYTDYYLDDVDYNIPHQTLISDQSDKYKEIVDMSLKDALEVVEKHGDKITQLGVNKTELVNCILGTLSIRRLDR